MLIHEPTLTFDTTLMLSCTEEGLHSKVDLARDSCANIRNKIPKFLKDDVKTYKKNN